MEGLIKTLVDNGAFVSVVLLLGYIPAGVAIVALWKALAKCQDEPREALDRSTAQLALVQAALTVQTSSREPMMLAIAAVTQSNEAVADRMDRLERLIDGRRSP